MPGVARSGGVNDHPWVCAPAHRWSLTPLREMAVAVEAPDAAKKRLPGPNERNIAASCAHVAREHGYLCPCCARARLLVPMLREHGYLCPNCDGTVDAWAVANLRRARGHHAHRVSRPGQERARGSLPGASTRTEFRPRGQNAHRVSRPGATTRMGPSVSACSETVTLSGLERMVEE